MARRARQKDEYGIYYIHQIGGGHRQIFESDDDRSRFLNILSKAHSKFSFKLYAYCLISSDAYHLIIDVNGGDLSKIMKSINISYAMYAKCEERLFRDRYRSTLLGSDSELTDALALIHENSQDHDNWNSFCVSQHDSDFTIDPVLTDDCKDCIRSVPEASVELTKLASAKNKSLDEIFHDKELRNDLIRKFRSHSTLSLKDLGQLFGGLSESSVSKILNQ